MMLRSEFATYQSKARIPIERALGHLDAIRRSTDCFSIELERELVVLRQVRPSLEALSDGPDRFAAALLLAESVLAEKSAQTRADLVALATAHSSAHLRLASDAFTLSGAHTDEFSSQDIDTLVSMAELLVTVGLAMGNGPIGTAIGLAAAAAQVHQSVLRNADQVAAQAKELRKHRQDESIRVVRESTIELVESLAEALEHLKDRTEDGWGPLLGEIRAIRERAETLTRSPQ